MGTCSNNKYTTDFFNNLIIALKLLIGDEELIGVSSVSIGIGILTE